MKRYIIEMANDFEKKIPEDKQAELLNIRNYYIIGLLSEIDAIKSIMKLLED